MDEDITLSFRVEQDDFVQLVDELFNDESNFNNRDIASGQRVLTKEEIETKLLNGERV